MTNELQAYIKERKIQIDKHLDLLLIPKYPQKIYESIRYSIFAGGKRLRPILMFLSFELFSSNIEKIIDFAVSIELIHTYSLIHDDLPSMDNDSYRRGMPTNHIVFGEGLAVLAGDALLNLAAENILKSIVKFGYSKEMIDAALYIFNCSGIDGMIGGQVVDILNQGKLINKDELELLHLNKTSKLIQASVVAGSLIGGAEEKIVKKLEEYAKYLGLAFQIRDDILDYIGDEEKLGKSIGKDQKNQKTTYVSMYGLEESQKLVDKYSNISIDIIKTIDNKGLLTELTNSLIYREQ
ncbi:polyprenyl synthetase family protein [Caldicellulosiruptoraceae bacterium PP1]